MRRRCRLAVADIRYSSWCDKYRVVHDGDDDCRGTLERGVTLRLIVPDEVMAPELSVAFGRETIGSRWNV